MVARTVLGRFVALFVIQLAVVGLAGCDKPAGREPADAVAKGRPPAADEFPRYANTNGLAPTEENFPRYANTNGLAPTEENFPRYANSNNLTPTAKNFPPLSTLVLPGPSFEDLPEAR